MEDSKPSALMEDWRNYLQDSNADIFEIIERSIMVAASDRPMEFQSRRDKIAQILFSGCKKQSHKVSPETEKETNLVSEGLNTSVLSNEKPPMVIKLKLKKETECQNPKVTPENKVNDVGASRVYNQQGVSLVLMIKKILDKTGDESESQSELVVCDLLTKLESMELTLKTLEATGIGKTVNALKKHASERVRKNIAVTLVKEWKRTLDEWLKKQSNDVKTVFQQVKPMNVNVNRERELEGSEKATKIGDGGVNVMLDSLEKLEATKRRLQQGYEKAENMKKKKRRIQVMELHQVAKEGLLPPRVKQIRRKVYGRR